MKRSADHLPSLLGSAVPTTPSRVVERAVSRDVAMVQGRARVLQARGRADTRAIEDVAVDAMYAGTSVSRQAVSLATICPVAEPMLRGIMEQTGMALGRIVSDTARDLRN